jgi:hypothetical protein
MGSMHRLNKLPWEHSHDFVGDSGTAEKNTRRVIVLTGAMMAVEINQCPGDSLGKNTAVELG